MVFAARGNDRGGRGRGFGGDRGGGRGRGGFGGGRGGFNQGPPAQVSPVATYANTVEGLICCMLDDKKVPLLMRSIYTQNKNLIGKVDDVFGPVTAPGIAIKPVDGINQDSFKAGDKVSEITLNYSNNLQ